MSSRMMTALLFVSVARLAMAAAAIKSGHPERFDPAHAAKAEPSTLRD